MILKNNKINWKVQSCETVLRELNVITPHCLLMIGCLDGSYAVDRSEIQVIQWAHYNSIPAEFFQASIFPGLRLTEET